MFNGDGVAGGRDSRIRRVHNGFVARSSTVVGAYRLCNFDVLSCIGRISTSRCDGRAYQDHSGLDEAVLRVEGVVWVCSSGGVGGRTWTGGCCIGVA